MVLSGGKQHRSAEAADQREGCKYLRILSQGQRDGGSGHKDHGRKSCAGRHQMIDLVRPPERQIEYPNADCLQRIGKMPVAVAAETFAPQDKSYACQQADGYASTRANPIVLERIFQEIGNADQNGNNANAVQPVLTDCLLQS